MSVHRPAGYAEDFSTMPSFLFTVKLLYVAFQRFFLNFFILKTTLIQMEFRVNMSEA